MAGHRRPIPMSGAYSIFPLRLVVVFNLTTCFIRNALAVSPLAAGIGAVDRIRPLGGKGFSASFADPVLPFFQSPPLQIFLIATVPTQMVIAIFLGFNQCVEIPSTALTDDFPYNGIWSYTSDFFLHTTVSAFPDFRIPNRSSTWNYPFLP